MKTTRHLRKFTVPLLVGGAAAALVLFSRTANVQAGVETAIGSDVESSELRAITIESWDSDYTGGGYGWEVVTNANETNPDADYEPAASNLKAEREVKLIRGTPRDIRYNDGYENAHILGVKFAFTFPGYNVVTVRPPMVDHYIIERVRPYLNEESARRGDYRNTSCYEDAAQSATRQTSRPVMIDCVRGIDMPGVVKKISVWVMGRGNEYDLEGWIEDWRGDTHILRFGSIDFIGWRPMTTTVPTNIPQDVQSFPQIKTLVFRQFKIRARPETSLEPVYVFFDELRVLTDIFEVHFDGAAIDFDRNDCERKNRLFSLIRQNARYPDHWPSLSNCENAPGPAEQTPAMQPRQQGANNGGGGQ
ncbi:MAG: endoflagellar filament sheath protein [Spirochaetales bacterium]|nr:endoflagellar filament sheath protein [Leptospiraceae bacterium]MCP5479858.1 endoflagellar filament sheath protein [Spirochaetales bacterium]MCP5486248.1 endoflagellar filament sheath protein [Spirochaetales bacterium]